jgi:kumamolisin
LLVDTAKSWGGSMRSSHLAGGAAFGAIAFVLSVIDPAWGQSVDVQNKVKAFGAGTETRTLQHGVVVTPRSSVPGPGPAHTNIHIFVPNGVTAQVEPLSSGLFFETPASLACVYHLVPRSGGCNPTLVTANASGGSRAIAVVDAFDAPNVAADLGSYSNEFGLPAVTSSNFEKVYACAWSGVGPPPPSICSGSQPEYDSGWELEESLDTQMAHAMAPSAKVFLVEAQSSSLSDLTAAELKAAYLVAQAGGGEVSNSWGAPEFVGETAGDVFFSTPGVVYFASTGDSPGTNYPSVSPNVVAVGGTSLSRNPLTGAFIGEATWSLAGGGPSTYEARPPYQNSVSRIVGASRGVPDVAVVANPVTGVWTYVSAQGGWLIVGGTSVGSPFVAAVVNNVGHFSLSTAVELSMTYNDPDYSHFSDIKDGTCGPHEGYFATTGWDFCAGLGSPRVKGGFVADK